MKKCYKMFFAQVVVYVYHTFSNHVKTESL